MPDIQVTFKLCGFLRKKVEGHQGGELTITLPAGSNAATAIDAIGLTGEVRMLMLNGKALLQDRKLADGDRLTLVPPQLAYNMYVATGFLAPSVRENIRQKRKEEGLD